jgi:uncharacterized membrane protein YuzA (DUF378 family)
MATPASATTTAGVAHSVSHGAGGLNSLGWIALVLMIVGSVNWGLVGVANFDLVAALFGAGSTLSRIVYALVGLAGLYGIVMALTLGKR